MSSFLPSDLINKALNAMDDTVRRLEALRNILRQTYGDEGWEVKTVQRCLDSVQGRHLKLQGEYTEFRDALFNHPDQYYEGLVKPLRAHTEPCGEPSCSVCKSSKSKDGDSG